MNYKELVNIAVKEVMSELSGSKENSFLPNGTEINVSGKTVVFLAPNLDINLADFTSLLLEFKKKNTVKAFFPKWGRTMQNDGGIKEIGIDISYIDFANNDNAKLISGNIFIVPVNNDNYLRKVSKLDRSNASTTSVVTALAMNSKVFFVPSGDYNPSQNLKNEVAKTKAFVCNILEIQKSYVSAITRPVVNNNLYETAKAQVSATHSSNPHCGPNDESNCFTCTTHDCISRCLSKVDVIMKAGANRVSGSIDLKEIPINIASYIDHTLLKPESTEDQVRKLCEEARKYTFASVCINPHFVPLAARMLQGSPVKVCTVIGFPLGATTTETKVYETKKAIADGAHEIDMVINVGALKSKDYSKVEDDIRQVVRACEGKILKVILETALLTKEEKIKACELSVKAGADFVKTSTGFGPGGATEEDIALMRAVVGPNLGVKASGGVRDTAGALSMLKAGATRIGASSSIAIVKNEAVDKNSKY